MFSIDIVPHLPLPHLPTHTTHAAKEVGPEGGCVCVEDVGATAMPPSYPAAAATAAAATATAAGMGGEGEGEVRGEVVEPPDRDGQRRREDKSRGREEKSRKRRSKRRREGEVAEEEPSTRGQDCKVRTGL